MIIISSLLCCKSSSVNEFDKKMKRDGSPRVELKNNATILLRGRRNACLKLILNYE